MALSKSLRKAFFFFAKTELFFTRELPKKTYYPLSIQNLVAMYLLYLLFDMLFMGVTLYCNAMACVTDIYKTSLIQETILETHRERSRSNLAVQQEIHAVRWRNNRKLHVESCTASKI